MTSYSERFKLVADGFERRVGQVAASAWDDPSPCAGWTARDIVRHLVDWIPGFFAGTAGLAFPAGRSVDDDPAAAWSTLRGALDAHLADPAVAGREFDAPMGRMSVEAAIDMIVTGDLLVHTWDLARACGLDESLDPGEVHRMLEEMEPLDEILRSSGHFGPRVTVDDDTDEQTKLIAFTGRDPRADRGLAP